MPKENSKQLYLLSFSSFPVLIIGKGCASVLKTQCSNGRISSSENNKYKYLEKNNKNALLIHYKIRNT